MGKCSSRLSESSGNLPIWLHLLIYFFSEVHGYKLIQLYTLKSSLMLDQIFLGSE